MQIIRVNIININKNIIVHFTCNGVVVFIVDSTVISWHLTTLPKVPAVKSDTI